MCGEQVSKRSDEAQVQNNEGGADDQKWRENRDLKGEEMSNEIKQEISGYEGNK